MSSLSLFDPGSLIASLLFIGAGIAMIAFGFSKRRRVHGQGKLRVLYQCFWIILGIVPLIVGFMSLTFGFMSLTFTNIFTFPISLSLFSALLIFFMFVMLAFSLYVFFRSIPHVLKLSTSFQQMVYVRRGNADPLLVASNPRLFMVRIVLIVEVCLLVIVTPFAIFQLSSLLVQHQLSFYAWSLLVLVLSIVFCLVRIYTIFRTLRCLEPLRFSRAAESRVGSISPDTAHPTFSDSLSITQRIKRTHLSVLAALLLGLMASGTGQIIQVSTFRDMFGNFFHFFFPVFIVTLLVTACLVPLFSIRIRIETTKYGLKTGSGGFISWQEARFFACYRLPGLLPGHKTMVVYELSSPDKVVTWLWIKDPQSPFTFLEPLVPARVYHRQMHALNNLVIDRTGLRLYDLNPLTKGREEDE